MKKVFSLVLCFVLVLSLIMSVSALSTVAVKSITLDKAAVTLNVGRTLTLGATFSPANTTQKLLKYATSDKNVASIDAKGKITAAKAGKATITVTSSSNSKVLAKCAVVVLPAIKGNVELKMFLVGNKQETDTDLVCSKINEYLKGKLDVTLKLQVFGWGNDYDQKVNTMLSSGEPIDIVFTANWAANYYLNAPNGYFLKLNDYIAQYPEITSILGKDFISGSAINGVNYAVPTHKETAHNWGFLLKKDLAVKYKINPASIKKTADLVPYFDLIKKNEPGITPLLMVGMDTPYHFIDWNNFSDDDVPGALYPDNRNTTVVNQFLAPETIAYYKEMRDYFLKGYIAKDAATMENTTEQMKSGKFFATEQPLKPGKDAEMNASTGIDWVQVEITKPVMSNRETSGAMLAVPAACKNPDRAFAFIAALYSDTVLRNFLNWGVEGVHYNKLSSNVIKQTQAGTDKFNLGSGWRYGDQFKDYLMDTEDPQKWVKFGEYNSKAFAEANLGFVYDAEITASQAAACKTVVGTYFRQLFTGSVDIDPTVKKFSDELKASGASVVIKNMQYQYDAWLAKNRK